MHGKDDDDTWGLGFRDIITNNGESSGLEYRNQNSDWVYGNSGFPKFGIPFWGSYGKKHRGFRGYKAIRPMERLHKAFRA